jgi:sugar lactone lactonase YvrE
MNTINHGNSEPSIPVDSYLVTDGSLRQSSRIASFGTKSPEYGLVVILSAGFSVQPHANRFSRKESNPPMRLRVLALVFLASWLLTPASGWADFYVSNQSGNSVSSVTPGGMVSPFLPGILAPEGMAFDSNGNLYIASSGSGTIIEVMAAGGVSTFATGLNNPLGLAFDSHGNLFVASQSGAITEITPGGTQIPFAQVPSAYGLAFSSNGTLYVSDPTGGSILQVVRGGLWSTWDTGFSTPEGIIFDGSGNLYVANESGNTVTQVTPSKSGSTYATGLSSPSGLTFDSNGNLYIANFGSNTVGMVGPGGGSSTTFASGFDGPTFITEGPEINATPAPSSLMLVGTGAFTLAIGVWWQRRSRLATLPASRG